VPVTAARPDTELIAAVRSGDAQAYDLLYRRHRGAARTQARQLATCAADADDLVAEAFARVLGTLLAGGGPDTAFRAYLLTVLRRIRYDRARHDRRVRLSDDMTRHDPAVPWEDTAVAGLESGLAARAYTRLPERWRAVLWHTEVERASPAEVARTLGMTPNGVSALAYRAREGLRQAYLQEHLRPAPDRHRAWTRGGLSGPQRARVDAHLATCADCRTLAAELADAGGALHRGPSRCPQRRSA
jgi:RNA polymerase sigma factor (sigma-70 family)